MNKISNNYYLGAQIYINYHCRTIQLSISYKYFTCTLFECKQQLFVVKNYIYNGSIRYEYKYNLKYINVFCLCYFFDIFDIYLFTNNSRLQQYYK